MPPKSFSVLEYTCSTCGKCSTDLPNMLRHAKRSCPAAQLSKRKLYAVTWTDDPEKAAAMREQNVPVLPGFHTSHGPVAVQTHDALTHRALMKPEVLAAGSEQEREFVCSLLVGDKLLRLVTLNGRPRAQGVCTRLFSACKLAASVPVAMRNLGVRGNTIIYKGEEDVEAMSKGRMSCTLLVWLLRILREALMRALEDEEDADRLAIFEHVWGAWFESAGGGAGGKYSLEDAAVAYDTNRNLFDDMRKDIQDRIRHETRGIAYVCDRLPAFHGPM